MTKLTRCINPLETDRLCCPSRSLFNQGLSQSHDAFLHTRTTSLDHDKIIVDRTVSDKATKRGDALLGSIEFSGTVGITLNAETDAVDFVVDRGSVHVAVVTGTRDGPHDVGRMPGTDTSDLAKTLVRLAR
jgi:hypothetical protein